NFDQQRFGIEFHFLEFTEPVPEFSQSAPAHGSLFADAVLALSLHVKFAFMGQQLDVQSRTNLLPWAANQLGLQLAQSAFRRPHQIDKWAAHCCASLRGLPRSGCLGPSPRFSGPYRIGLSIFLRKSRNVVLSLVLPASTS